MHEAFIQRVQDMRITVQTGMFAAMIGVSLVNDGPVTTSIDSRE